MLNAFELVDRVRAHSPALANALLNQVVPTLIPLARGLRVKVRELTPTHIEMTLPLRRRSRNHLGSMYFGAQMTLADLAVGVLLFQRFPPGPFAGVIKRVEADFRAKAKSDLTCVGDLDAALVDAFEAVRTNESGKVEAWVPLRLVDREGQTTTEVRFLVAIKRNRPRS